MHGRPMQTKRAVLVQTEEGLLDESQSLSSNLGKHKQTTIGALAL